MLKVRAVTLRAVGIALLSLVFVAPGASVAAGDPSVTGGATIPDMLVVRVHGLRNNHGSVRCVLYDGPEQFPVGLSRVVARVRSQPTGSTAVCVFSNVARGKQYAVVIHHDENDDAVFQRGAFGRPLEGYGFSNDVRPVLAAPSFDACRFQFCGGTRLMSIMARY